MRFTNLAITIALICVSSTPAIASAKKPAASHRHAHAHAHKSAKHATSGRKIVKHHAPARTAQASLPAQESIASMPAVGSNYVLKNTLLGQDSAAVGIDASDVKADLVLMASNDAVNPVIVAETVSATAVEPTAVVALRPVATSAKAGIAGKINTASEDAPQLVAKAGVVSGKGMRSFAQAGIPQSVVTQVAAAFGHDPALHGAPPEHAEFHVVYENKLVGKARRPHPELRLASLTIAGKEHRVYCYPVEHDGLAFVDSSGRGVMPVDLAAPVPGAPITSPFGWRIHPILEIRKFHEGVDFGAPTGTPVRAAEDGTVEDVGFRGNYGNYVRVRHSDQLETAYAHLNGFATGLHAGSQVRRGQIIAYIGTTGWATGPHLYYEVIVDGEHLDPLRRDLSLKVRFEGAALRRFKSFTDLLAAHTRSVVNKTACLLPMCQGKADLG